MNQKNNEGFRVVYVLRKCVKTFTFSQIIVLELFLFLESKGLLKYNTKKEIFCRNFGLAVEASSWGKVITLTL